MIMSINDIFYEPLRIHKNAFGISPAKKLCLHIIVTDGEVSYKEVKYTD